MTKVWQTPYSRGSTPYPILLTNQSVISSLIFCHSYLVDSTNDETSFFKYYLQVKWLLYDKQLVHNFDESICI